MTNQDPPSPAPSADPEHHEPGSGSPPSVPTPVRSSLGPTPSQEEPAAEAAAAPARTLEVDGRVWTVRALGASLAGPGSAPLPLVLVGFFPDEEAAAPEREALVPAASLSAVPSAELEAAFHRGQIPPPPGVRKPLFPEITTKGDRRDG